MGRSGRAVGGRDSANEPQKRALELTERKSGVASEGDEAKAWFASVRRPWAASAHSTAPSGGVSGTIASSCILQGCQEHAASSPRPVLSPGPRRLMRIVDARESHRARTMPLRKLGESATAAPKPRRATRCRGDDTGPRFSSPTSLAHPLHLLTRSDGCRRLQLPPGCPRQGRRAAGTSARGDTGDRAGGAGMPGGAGEGALAQQGGQ